MLAYLQDISRVISAQNLWHAMTPEERDKNRVRVFGFIDRQVEEMEEWKQELEQLATDQPRWWNWVRPKPK